MVKWPFGKVKWPSTRGWKGHFESPGMHSIDGCWWRNFGQSVKVDMLPKTTGFYSSGFSSISIREMNQIENWCYIEIIKMMNLKNWCASRVIGFEIISEPEPAYSLNKDHWVTQSWQLPGDSKCPFYPLVGGQLTPWKGHLTIPKRSLWITWCLFIYFVLWWKKIVIRSPSVKFAEAALCPHVWLRVGWKRGRYPAGFPCRRMGSDG